MVYLKRASLGRLAFPVACNVEEDLLHRLSSVARDKLRRRALIDDLSRLHHQHVVAEPLQQGRTQQLWLVVVSRAQDGKAVARGQVRLQNIAAE